MAKREKLTTNVKNVLDNFFKSVGVNLGKLIKQAHDGALSSNLRSAFNSDFLGAKQTNHTPAGTIAVTPHADSAGTPEGTNAASEVTGKWQADPTMCTKPVIALTHNADPVTNLDAAILYAYEAQDGCGINTLHLESPTNANADVLGETANGVGGGAAASCRFFVFDNNSPNGVPIYVNESESDRLEMVSPTEEDGYIIMPFETVAGAVPGFAVAVKVYHSADAADGKPLFFDDNGAADAQLCFVDTGASGGVIPAGDIQVISMSYIDSTGAIGEAAAQAFTGSALATHSHANTAAFTGTAASANDTFDGYKFATTQTGGSPVAGLKSNGERGIAELYLAANDEAETARMDFGDQLCIDIEDEPYIEMLLSYEGTDSEASEAVFGLASAHNATLDSVAAMAWFKITDDGTDTVLVCETDANGAGDTDDQATGITLVEGTKYLFKIDMKDDSNVKFYVNNQRVCAGVTFDMSNYTGNLQPYVRVGKASGASEAKIEVDFIRGETNRE